MYFLNLNFYTVYICDNRNSKRIHCVKRNSQVSQDIELQSRLKPIMYVFTLQFFWSVYTLVIHSIQIYIVYRTTCVYMYCLLGYYDFTKRWLLRNHPLYIYAHLPFLLRPSAVLIRFCLINVYILLVVYRAFVFYFYPESKYVLKSFLRKQSYSLLSQSERNV